jgi:hypothetical protein
MPPVGRYAGVMKTRADLSRATLALLASVLHSP